MLSLSHFLLFAFSQIATPGPANMIMLATGAKYGFRNAIPFVFGVIVGKQIIIWEANYLKQQLIRFKGNIARTSNFVGMDRSALHRKIKELDININKFN